MTFIPLLLAALASSIYLYLPEIFFDDSLVKSTSKTCLFYSLAIFVPIYLLLLQRFLSDSLQASAITYQIIFSRGMIGLFGGAFVFHGIAVLFGAPFFELFRKTMGWSFLQASLATMPAACAFGNDFDKWRRCFARSEPRDVVEVFISVPAIGSIMGSWFGAIPIPLDWDRPWQAWPVTCVYGTLIGYFIGTLVAYTISWHFEMSGTHKKKRMK